MLTDTKDDLELKSPELPVNRGSLTLRPVSAAPTPQTNLKAPAGPALQKPVVASSPAIPAPQTNLKAPGPDELFAGPSAQKPAVVGSPAISTAPVPAANSAPTFRNRWAALTPAAVHASAPSQPAPGPNPLHRYARMAHHHQERKNMRNYKHALKDIFGLNSPGQKPHAKKPEDKKNLAAKNPAKAEAGTIWTRAETQHGEGVFRQTPDGQRTVQRPAGPNGNNNSKTLAGPARAPNASMRPAGMTFTL